MLLLSQAPSRGEALSATRCCSLKFTHPNPNSTLFSNRKPKSIPRNPRRGLNLTVASGEDQGGGVDSTSTKQPFSTSSSSSSSSTTPSPPFNTDDDVVFVGQENLPLEGVIQFEKPYSSSSSSRLNKWGRAALISGGDVLVLLLFSAIGRFSHGFSVLDIETLRTADPFIAGWFLSAYFLGGYAEDGRGMNGLSKAVIAAAKSWSLGIPLGIIIRAATSGRIPPSNFIIVTMGSTAVLLIGWRALLFSIFPNDKSKKSDVYRRGSPFELFELLTSLVRRW